MEKEFQAGTHEGVAEMECPACGGSMHFDPVSGKMVCDYCGTAVEIESKPGAAAGGKTGATDAVGAVTGATAAGATAAAGTATTGGKTESAAAGGKAEDKDAGGEVSGFDFASLNDQAVDLNAENLPIYLCKSCGAELIAPPQQISMTCPYCNSNIVLTQKISGKLRPNGIIPFKIDKKALPDAMNRYYKGKVLLPKKFFSESTMGKVTGVYVPFWIFNGNVSGNLSFHGDTTERHRQGDYEVVTTSTYSLDRAVSMAFENVPVDASGRIDDVLMDSLEPFDMREVKEFDMRYLAGYTSERFDEAKNTIEERAKNRMFTTAGNAVLPHVGAGYSNVRRAGGKLKAELNAKYILLPVYMFSIAFGGQKYEFSVNGQTGRVVGNLPIDKGVCTEFFIKRALTVAAGIVLFFISKYLLGW
ncbi:MAG: TFIIB-type zinc ribbon-containing protein [Lachnospiraceae bacterium]|nr:TFIIB-type zinc ribbon-containing protein [Lachnospiraceae bacterium]